MAKKFLGVPYPVTANALGFFYSQHGVNQIKSDLLILLLTNPGERVFLPTFGTPLRRLVFEPNDSTLAAKAKQMIIQSIKKWEPRIAVKQIQVTNTMDTKSANLADDESEFGAVLNIKIVFVDPENISEIQQLVLEVPLSGG